MHLLIILDDRLSDWEVKGEILNGYFNPDGLFSHVTIISLLEDSPSKNIISSLVAPANGRFISLGKTRAAITLKTLGLRRSQLDSFFKPMCEIIQSISPNLIRSYGESLGTVAASYVKQELGLPYVVSLHNTPAPHIIRQYETLREKIWRSLLRKSIKIALDQADGILAVYSPILAHLSEVARAKSVIIPNVVGTSTACQAAFADDKRAQEEKLRILWVGRLIPGRNLAPILKSISVLEQTELTIIGDGPLRKDVCQLIDHYKIGDRVKMIPSLKNSKLINQLMDFDVMALQTSYEEVAKPILEASLAGLPIILNENPSSKIEEYENIPIIFVQDSASAYTTAFKRMLNDPIFLQDSAKKLKKKAWSCWDPDIINKRTATFLRDVIKNHKGETK